MPGFSLSHQKPPANKFSLVPNDAVKRRGAFESINPADLLLWMALRATMPREYRSNAELARVVGSDWNVVRSQLRNLEAKGLIHFDAGGIHTVIPGEDDPASQEQPSKADPPDAQLDLRDEWNRALDAIKDKYVWAWLEEVGSLTRLAHGHAQIFVNDPNPLETHELKGLEEAFSKTSGHKVTVTAMYWEP